MAFTWADEPSATATPTPGGFSWADEPTPTAVADTGEGDGFLAKINAFLRKPSPEWLQAPEQVARETITGMMPHDVPSYLESIYPPAAMAHRAVDVGEQLAQGDVSGVPFVGRVPEIIAAEDTPAGSVERYRTARNTLMDLGLLAGVGEAEPVAAAIKRTSPEATLAEKITQPRVEPAPQEPLAPVTPETPPAPEVADTGLGFKTAFSNVNATADLYQQAFDALRAGQNTISGVRDPILARHKAAFDRGEIKSPEDLKIAEEGKGAGGITPEAAARAAAAPPTPEAPALGRVPVVPETPSGAEPPPVPPVAEPITPAPEGGGLRVTSTKNAVVDQERVARGLTPILSEASRTAPELVAQADARMTQNPRYADKLVSELAKGTRTALDPVDEAVLLTHKTTLQNAKFHVGERALNPALSDFQRAEARTEFDDLEAQLHTMDQASRRGGTLWSEQGRFRQQLMAEDYSIVAMEQRMRIAKGGAPLTPEESAKIQSGVGKLNALQAKIDAKNARLELAIAQRKGLAPPRPARPEPIAGDVETEALQTELAKLKAEERYANALPAAKDRITKRIAELQARMSEYGYAKPTKRIPVEADAELRRLQYEYSLAQAELDRGIFQAQLKNRSLPARIWQTGRELLAMPRALMASTDLSAVRRQGGLIFMGNPIRSLRNFAPMLKAARSPQGYFEVMQEIRERPNAPLYEASKLGLTDIAAPKLSQMEEMYMSRWANAIPIVSHSQRAYVAFLNRLRADSFDAMAKTLSRDGTVTPQQAKDLSNFINVFTGRGTFSGQYADAAAAMNNVFFAPRYVVSRFQALTGQPIWGAKDPLARRAIAKEYAKTLIGYGVLYTLAATALKQFVDVEWDPRSTDFGKLKIGNTRIDPLSGLSQATVVSARLGSTLAEKLAKQFGYELPIGKFKTPSGELKTISGGGFADTTATEIAGRFVRSKLAPVPAALFNIWDGKNYVGDPTALIKTEKEFPWVSGEIPRLLSPLSGSDIYDAMKEQGVAPGAALGVLAIFGDGLQTYSARVPPQHLGPKKLSVPKQQRVPTLQQQMQKLQSIGP